MSKTGGPTGGMEYSEARRKRKAAAARKAKRAHPAAGPVTVTRADGSVHVEPPKNTGADQPNRRR